MCWKPFTTLAAEIIMAGRKHSHGSLSFHIEQNENGSLFASVVHEPHRPPQDDVGALYYVVVVIFIYGCSILMMIASYIRKNKIDQKLNRYLKEMANVRKREQQMQLFQAARKAAEVTRNSEGNIRCPLRRDRRTYSQASEFSDIEEIVVIETPEDGRRPEEDDEEIKITTPLVQPETSDSRKSPSSGRQPKGSVRILCTDEDTSGDEQANVSEDGVRIKTVTVFEPKTGKSLQLWLRQGAPGGACLEKKRESPDGQDLSPGVSDSDDIGDGEDEEETEGGGDDSSGSFNSDCQIVTSV